MIDAKDLRISNLVLHNGQIDEVYAIHYQDAQMQPYKVFLQNGRNRMGVSLLDIYPIPLTPEILEKCGFEKQDNRWYKLNICEDYINLYFESLAKAELSISGLGMKLPHIEHLHQLQNLIYSLTKQELEYKP